MRIYLPVTTAQLCHDVIDSDEAYALTPGLIDIVGSDLPEEELEELARGLATQASLQAGLHAFGDSGQAVRRIVASADIDGYLPEENPGQVRLEKPIAWAKVVSIHIDDDIAAQYWYDQLSQRPLQSVDDEAINAWLEQCDEDFELDWYDITELDTLREMMTN